MIRQTESAAEDRTRHLGTVKHPAHGHRRDAHGVSRRHIVERRQQFLEQPPATPGVHHALVLLEAGRVECGAARLGLAQVPLGQESATNGPVREQTNAGPATEGAQLDLRPPVDQRVLDLI